MIKDEDKKVPWYLTAVDWLMRQIASLRARPEIKDAPWMVAANAEVGVKEYAGPDDNPRIVEYFTATNIGAPYSENDETPWCSAFTNWALKQAGVPGTNSAAAASWRNWGHELEHGQYGCIVVMERPGGNHVGFYVRESAQGVSVLGGNQSDAVNIKIFPWESITNFRWPD